MNTREFPYKTFNFVSERIVADVDSVRGFLMNSKTTILENFKDIFNLDKVYDFAVANLSEFNVIVIYNEKKQAKPVLECRSANPALKLFEMVFNINGLPQAEVDMIKKFFFVKQVIEEQEVYVFIKDMKVIEGEPIRKSLITSFNALKEVNPEIQNHSDLFRSVSEYAKDGYIICRKAEDVRGKIHFETLLNPKVAIDSKKKEQIANNLKGLEPLLT